MKRIIKYVLSNSAFRFGIVGLINTLVGSTIMFCAYNIFNFNYWISSALNYILASILSYILNKNFTFQYKSSDFITGLKFVINIIVCYITSYAFSKVVLTHVLCIPSSIEFIDNVSMLLGSVIFIVFNYFGQRFFVFKKLHR